MTTFTREELATRMLRDLGLIAPEETPSAEDMEWATETVSAEVATLSSIGMTIWNGSDMVVPLEYLTPLSRRIGLAVAPSFGLLSPAEALLAMPEAERQLVSLAAPRLGSPLSLRTDDALRGRGSFSFTTGR